MIDRFHVLGFVCAGIMLASSGSVLAQIPNAGFESWSGGNPTGWQTTNDSLVVTNVTQTSSSHSGSSAVHGAVVSLAGFSFPPSIGAGVDGDGFPVSARHEAVHGWYKFSPQGNDQMYVTVGMNDADSAVGVAAQFITGAQNTYREFAVNIFYDPSFTQIPDTCYIFIVIFGQGGGLSTVGSTFDIDDLAFGPATSVDQYGNALPESFELLQNYPNPFNPRTLIQYAIPYGTHVQLSVFNALGQEVARLVDAQQDAGAYRTEFDATGFPTGTYFYRLQAGEFSQVKKLMLVK